MDKSNVLLIFLAGILLIVIMLISTIVNISKISKNLKTNNENIVIEENNTSKNN